MKPAALAAALALTASAGAFDLNAVNRGPRYPRGIQESAAATELSRWIAADHDYAFAFPEASDYFDGQVTALVTALYLVECYGVTDWTCDQVLIQYSDEQIVGGLEPDIEAQGELDAYQEAWEMIFQQLNGRAPGAP